MAGVSDKRLARMRGWPGGIDNQSPETDLARDENGATMALREAENVDLARGKVSRRQGFTEVMAGARVHSLWRAGTWPFALVVADGVLRGFDGEIAYDIRMGLDPRAPVAYALASGRVYFTNGRETGTVRVNATAGLWGCPNPAGQPVVSAQADAGGLHAGTYQVAITYLTVDGEESGTGRAVEVDVPAGGGIALTAIPQPIDEAVATVRVYVSEANGATLYQRQDLAAGVPVAMIGAGRHGKPLDTQFMEPMAPARFVALHAGRLFTLGAGATLGWSEALRYGLTRPTANRMRFTGAGQLVVAVGQGGEGAGLYVAAGKRTYFLSGPPEQMRPRIAYPHGAVAGTAVNVPGSVFGLEAAEEVAYWMAANGVGVLGLPGGQVVPVRERQAVAPEARAGASLYRAADGQHQVVTTLQGSGNPRSLAMRDRTVVTVERHDQA